MAGQYTEPTIFVRANTAASLLRSPCDHTIFVLHPVQKHIFARVKTRRKLAVIAGIDVKIRVRIALVVYPRLPFGDAKLHQGGHHSLHVDQIRKVFRVDTNEAALGYGVGLPSPDFTHRAKFARCRSFCDETPDAREIVQLWKEHPFA